MSWFRVANQKSVSSLLIKESSPSLESQLRASSRLTSRCKAASEDSSSSKISQWISIVINKKGRFARAYSILLLVPENPSETGLPHTTLISNSRVSFGGSGNFSVPYCVLKYLGFLMFYDHCLVTSGLSSGETVLFIRAFPGLLQCSLIESAP